MTVKAASPLGQRYPALKNWTDAEHQDLWQQAQNAMQYGSYVRSKEDAVRQVLQSQLPNGRYDDHRRYVELECIRIVEQLRLVRDVYQRSLTEDGEKPTLYVAYMIHQHAVERRAVPFLQEVMVDYLMKTQVDLDLWRMLFGLDAWSYLIPGGPAREVHHMAEISRTVQSLFEGTTLYSAEAGGPFGRNAQKSLACSRPWFEVSAQSKAIAEMVAQRLSMWDACSFWTQGLVALFDCCRGELFRQRGLLASNSRPGEPTVDNLSPFELIVHQHLSKAKLNSVGGKKHGGEFWRALFRHLDSEGILPEKQLEGIAKKLLMKARQKGYKVDTWAESYECKVQAILDNEKLYVLKRELTHALHNADRKAKNHLKKLGF